MTLRRTGEQERPGSRRLRRSVQTLAGLDLRWLCRLTDEGGDAVADRAKSFTLRVLRRKGKLASSPMVGASQPDFDVNAAMCQPIPRDDCYHLGLGWFVRPARQRTSSRNVESMIAGLEERLHVRRLRVHRGQFDENSNHRRSQTIICKTATSANVCVAAASTMSPRGAIGPWKRFNPSCRASPLPGARGRIPNCCRAR